MNQLLKDILRNKLLWLLAFVPAVFVAQKVTHDAHTLLFILSVLAIVPLTVLLSLATVSVAAKTGDAIGGLLNATLGNLAELVIALAALRAGQYMLVKASIAGTIVTNTLFILGASFLLGGLKHHEQEYNRVSARLQAGLLFLATVALLIPSAISHADAAGVTFSNKLSVGLAVLLIVTYGLSTLFSLVTHKESFGSVQHAEVGDAPWPIGVAVGTLVGVTVLVALVSEVFVESVQQAAEAFGMTPAFVGFIIMALVGGASAMPTAFSGARSNRLDLSVGIALGSSSQIALFVAPVLVLVSYFIGPSPMDLQFWPGAVVMMLVAAMATSMVTSSGRSAWFVGVMLLMVYAIFAMTLYMLPPRETAPAAASAAPEWHYEGAEGPANWGTLSPTFAACSAGRHQSPIDITGATPGPTEALRTSFPPAELRIAHHEHIADGINNGHTIQINYPDAETLTLGGVPYQLAQYHFHGPSEHTIDGKRFPMEMHLVHKGAGDKLAVVGVLIAEGAHNKAFDPIWANLPAQKGVETHYPAVKVDVDALLPAARTSYRYDGSLTTPPCSEGVSWIVMTTPIELSSEQIAAFTRLIKDNYRPVQTLNGRTILTDAVSIAAADK